VIPLTRLNGGSFGVNPDAIVRADVTPDTVLTLSDGSKYVVRESLAEVIDLVVEFRAAVRRRAAEPPTFGLVVGAPDDADGGPEHDPDVIRLRPRKG
jgi:flagellar protein FlbD